MAGLDLDHVGTRLEHLADLHKLWSDGIGIITQQTYLTEMEQELVADLEKCLKHLENHMAKDYNCSPYAREINRIGTNPPEDVK
jgi:hypothetical protein